MSEAIDKLAKEKDEFQKRANELKDQRNKLHERSKNRSGKDT